MKTGATICGKHSSYTITNKIGQGGLGVVFKAVNTLDGTTVAVKTLKNDIDSALYLSRHIRSFEREQQIGSIVQHPNIVQLLDTGYFGDGQPVTVFEFVQGETLKDIILHNGIIPVVKTKQMMLQVLDALIYLQSVNIVHADLKPQNIMVSGYHAGVYVRLLDFGNSAFTTPAPGYGNDGAYPLMCTVPYCAPEQLNGGQVSIKSDLYAWGQVLLECLTGLPAKSRAEAVLLYNTDACLPEDVRSTSLGALLERVLNKCADHRTGDVHAVKKEFSEIDLSCFANKMHPYRPGIPVNDCDTAPVQDIIGMRNAGAGYYI